ncbi:MAG: right-handed parallel beta-helix repeat-containing protein, partial [Nanoarchaeota archaeon]|nr:right-handed parallel beta-helix repeat-containing protein [Nanoarchaeota archaeon]
MDYKKTESWIIAIVLIFAIVGLIANVTFADLTGQAYKKISHSAPVPNAACGDVIKNSLVLNTNLNCDNTGLFVGANDITIDCNGHTISYSKSNYGYGINNEQGYNDVTIQNCKIQEKGTEKLIVRYGIYFKDDENSNIYNNDIKIISSRAAIKMEDSQNLNLKENTIKVDAPWMSGIWLNGIEEGIIDKNKISTIGDSEYGINVRYSDKIIVENNYVNTDGYGTQAIYFTGSNKIYINNNYVKTSTKSGSNG